MWSPPGYLLFIREGTLFAQRMDPKAFQLEGEARAVAQDVSANDNIGRSTFAVSRTASWPIAPARVPIRRNSPGATAAENSSA
jgi:hypothetical protein